MYRPALVELLDPAERLRRETLRRDADRVRFTLGAVTLRLGAAAALDVDAADVRVRRVCRDCRGPHGRPELPGTDLYASVAHSGERVAVALTRTAPVGVDVEVLHAVDLDTLPASVLGAGEQVTDERGFFRYWTRKEAVVKATGDGLRVPLTQVLVGRPDAPGRLLSYPGRPGLVASITDLDAGADYAAALAVLHPRRAAVTPLDAAGLLAAGHGGPAPRSVACAPAVPRDG
jgi:4'-phosphopantetheinyl transferase